MRKNNSVIKKFVSLASAFIFAFSTSTTALAAAPSEEIPYFIINESEIVYYGQDYENPETGEYFRWKTTENARGETAKEFEFKIHYSIESSKFTINSTKVLVSCNAWVCDASEKEIGGYRGHRYEVEIIGILSRSLKFAVDGTESGTITGLSNGGSYKVKVTNSDKLPDNPYLYLTGSGKVECK